MEIRYKVTFRCGMAMGVADLAFDDLGEFAKGKIIDKIESYPVGNDPYSRHTRNTPDPDLDDDKSRHRAL